MPAFTLKSLIARRAKATRRAKEFERRRARYIAAADNLAGAIQAAVDEVTKADTAIAALEAYAAHLSCRPPRTRARIGARNSARDQAIVAAVTAAGPEGILRDDLYDNLERDGVALPSRKSFAVSLSFFARKGQIAFRGNKWLLSELAPPLPPPAIVEAQRLVAEAPNGLNRPEIEAALQAKGIPFTPKSLITQLGNKLREGKLRFIGGRYRSPEA